MATRLLDQFGFPMARAGARGQLLDATRRGEDSHAPDWHNRPQDTIKAIPHHDYLSTVAYSRRLFANLDPLKYASEQKAMHAVGRAWAPIFLGGRGDKAAIEWGEQAKEWLVNYYFRICDIRGRDDFQTALDLDSRVIDRDGESPLVYTQSEDGFPMEQRIPCHRIGNQWGGYNHGPVLVGDEALTWVDGEFRPGMYKGLLIEQGVIYNPAGRAVAYRVLGASESDTPQDISARDMDMCGEPEYVDQGRCLPVISGSINFLASALKVHGYEQQAMELNGSIAMIESNALGGADTSDMAVINQQQLEAMNELPAAQRGLYVQRMVGGTVMYVRSDDPNAGVKPYSNPSRPGGEWDAFNDRIFRISFSRIWPYGLVWKPEGANGTFDRTLIETARAMVKNRQDLLRPRARRSCGRAAAMAIKREELPPYPGQDPGGFLQWGFEMPEEFSIDHGREDSQWLDMYRAGAVTMQQWLDANHRGGFERLCEQRARESAIRKKVRARVEIEEGVQIDPREMQMLTPNDQPAAANENQDTPPEDNAPVTSDIEQTASEMNAYGVGVRAGSITPSQPDEEHFRKKLGLPPLTPHADSAWQEDGGVRRPITLVGKEGGQPGQSADPNQSPDQPAEQ